jgi:hypothetical protein
LCIMNTRGNMLTVQRLWLSLIQVECGYLVKNEKGTGVFRWAQHAFKVLADKKGCI